MTTPATVSRCRAVTSRDLPSETLPIGEYLATLLFAVGVRTDETALEAIERARIDLYATNPVTSGSDRGGYNVHGLSFLTSTYVSRLTK
jgi:hypothetical protein